MLGIIIRPVKMLVRETVRESKHNLIAAGVFAQLNSQGTIAATTGTCATIAATIAATFKDLCTCNSF